MWLTGQCGSTFGLWLAGPAEGCQGRTTMTRYWSPSSAGTEDGWWALACCVGGAGRDLRHVGVRGGDWCGGPRCGRALMLRAASSRVASWRSARTRPVPPGLGRADGRGVVMRCHEPLARGSGARHTIRAVWFGANRACRQAFRDAQGCYGWAGGLRRCHGVVTSGAKHGGTEADALRRFLQVGEMVGTGWDG
jgi:hypothetical protein